jgi:hypothetical protein
LDRQVDSTGDDRTVNNVGNAARHAYRVLSDEEKKLVVEIKDLGQAFLDRVNAIGASRELSIARTKAEEAIMWAVKHVTA